MSVSLEGSPKNRLRLAGRLPLDRRVVPDAAFQEYRERFPRNSIAETGGPDQRQDARFDRFLNPGQASTITCRAESAESPRA